MFVSAAAALLLASGCSSFGLDLNLECQLEVIHVDLAPFTSGLLDVDGLLLRLSRFDSLRLSLTGVFPRISDCCCLSLSFHVCLRILMSRASLSRCGPREREKQKQQQPQQHLGLGSHF